MKSTLKNFMLIILIFTFFACSKDDKGPAIRKVEYRMICDNVYPLNIQYINENGEQVLISNNIPLMWSSPVLNIAEDVPLKITAVGENQVGVSNLRVYIYVDGEEKANAVGDESSMTIIATATY